jgi:hypothetical protein
VANVQQDLEQRIALTQQVLAEVERRRIFTADPIERPQIEKRIEELQKDLFEDRKRLAALSSEPIPERPGESSDSRPLIFISYAHADREWLDRLLDYLKPLKRDAILEIWDDARIEAGSRWREQIETELQAARVAVLLVSADYLASDYVMDRELPFLLEAAQDRGLHVLSVIVSPCRFERTPLRQFQAVNSPSSPLTSKSRQEQEHIFAIVAESIRKILMSPPRQLSTVQD